MHGLGECVSDAAQQGADRCCGDTVQDRPVQVSAQAAERRPVAAIERHAGFLQAHRPEQQVGVQHGEQATGRAGRLPAQPDRGGAIAPHRADEAHLNLFRDP